MMAETQDAMRPKVEQLHILKASTESQIEIAFTSPRSTPRRRAG